MASRLATTTLRSTGERLFGITTHIFSELILSSGFRPAPGYGYNETLPTASKPS
jgi:hypothetical protein